MRSAVITYVLLAAGAPLVAAAPGRDETTERISYNQRATPPTAAAREPGWVEIASPTPASHGREFIEVGASAGAFTQLRIAAAAGRPEIRTVRVDYQDGSHKVFQVGRVLHKQRPPAYIDLRGAREIKQIIVSSARTSPGTYVLEGNTGAAGVAAR